MANFVIQIFNGDWGLGGGLVAFLILGFQAWMLVDAFRRGQYIWAVFILIFSVFTAVLYFFLVYRASGGGNPLTGFELPGAADRRQIKTLQAAIHHLDKPHHHLQLGDIYLSQGKFDQALQSYQAAYERDPQDADIRAHLGNCLARMNRTQEALPLLQGVCAMNPRHDYGYTLMTLAETEAAGGHPDQALAIWRRVLALYSYSRARVQFADLLIQKKEYAEARKNLEEVIQEGPYAPKFSRKREAIWLKRARALRKTLPS